MAGDIEPRFPTFYAIEIGSLAEILRDRFRRLVAIEASQAERRTVRLALILVNAAGAACRESQADCAEQQASDDSAQHRQIFPW